MSTATILLPVTGDEAAIMSLIGSVGRIHRRGYDVQTKTLPGNFTGPSNSNAWDERWETPLSLEWKNLKIDVAGGFARCDGLLRVSVTKKGAERPTRSWRCVSVRLQRIEDEWQFVHVHFRSVLHQRSPLQAV